MATRSRIVYQGPSRLDGEPIIGILALRSSNRKTGPSAQLWILHAGMDPRMASRTGADASICGACEMRGSPTDRADGVASMRRCYVQLQNAPTSMYRAYQRGSYVPLLARDYGAVLTGRYLRLGAYGDPAALPYEIISRLVDAADGHTGYTHQWADCDPRFAGILMASTSSMVGTIGQASANGWREFAVYGADEPRPRGYGMCPSSAEAGHRVQCNACQLCNGTSRHANSMAIRDHGPQRKRKSV